MTASFVVGIDFGTTYSTVYAHRTAPATAAKPISRPPPSMKRIGNYPNALSHGNIIEVPSAILYFPRTNIVKWGWDVNLSISNPVEVDYIKIEEFKLLLDEREFLRAQRDGLIRTLNRIGWTVEDVIYYYLLELLRHTKTQLEKYHQYSPQDSVQLVATVPAIWDGVADTKMVHCLTKVAATLEFGQGNDIALVSEPAAVATYFCEMEITEYPFLELGDSFLICDNGGGTCDLISYRLDSVDPPRFSEVVAGDGDTCGSVYVNRAYRSWLRQMFTTDEQYQPLNDPDLGGYNKIIEMAIPDFELFTKRQFGNDPELEIAISLPIWHKLKEQTIKYHYIERSVMEGFFQPSLNRIRELIQRQLDENEKAGNPCKKTIMAGGFSSSAHLVGFLEAAFPQLSFKLRDPVEKENPIAYGAVLCYLSKEGGPKEILRAAYGFIRSERYQPELFEGHTLDATFKDKVDGRLYVADCIAYFALKDHISPPGGEVFSLDQIDGGMVEWLITDINDDLKIHQDIVENRVASIAKNHYPASHSRNKGYVILGQLEFVVPSARLKTYKDALAIQLKQEGSGTREGTLRALESDIKILSKRLLSSRKQYFVLHSHIKFRKLCKNIQYELWIGGVREALGHIVPRYEYEPMDLSAELENLEI